MVKVSVLLFDSEHKARFLKGNLEDGCLDIEEKRFFIDKATPLMLKTFTGWKPLFILKWDDVEPSTNINPVRPMNPKFKGMKESDVTPELLRKMMGMKILGNMIKTRKPMPLSGLMLLFLGLVMGICLLYSLIYFKVVPVW